MITIINVFLFAALIAWIIGLDDFPSRRGK
jgi:hypothetical protein